MKSSLLISSLSVLLPGALAFVGIDKEMYQPSCAHACRYSIQSNPLTCSEEGSHAGGHMGHSSGISTTPACRATNVPFLTTLAYCISQTCTDVDAWKLERYWKERSTPSTGEKFVVPDWSYEETLNLITETPTVEIASSKLELNYTALIPATKVANNKGTLEAFAHQETYHARYALVLLLVGVGIPILFSVANFLSCESGFSDMVKPYLQRVTYGTRHVQRLPYFLGNMPTIGQTLYIVFFLLLNVLFTAVNYPSFQPNTWFDGTWQEIMAYMSSRTGVLAFGFAPLVFLFAGRNNFLLWITGWSHSTYVLLHRWVARIFTLQVVLHSILEIILYKAMLGPDIVAEQAKPYWVWGIVGTLAACIMVVISSVFFRRLAYEIFLVVHIILAGFVLIGSWYHVELLFKKRWGYEYWMYACFAVWGFDRIMRVIRILKVGVRRSKLTEIGPNIVRVDIEGVRWNATPGQHTYAYFPTLNPFRPWENHPFSVVPTAMLADRAAPPSNNTKTTTDSASTSSIDDIEKIGAHKTVTTSVHSTYTPLITTTGVSLFIRKSTGMTSLLRSHARLFTLLDGPYSNASPSTVLKCDRLLLIGGGIGFTAILPYLRHHVNTKLYWSVKSENADLVKSLEAPLSLAHEKDVKIGERLDVQSILDREAAQGWLRIGVVACGPPELCDKVRDVVTRMGIEGRSVFDLQVDAFSW